MSKEFKQLVAPSNFIELSKEEMEQISNHYIRPVPVTIPLLLLKFNVSGLSRTFPKLSPTRT